MSPAFVELGVESAAIQPFAIPPWPYSKGRPVKPLGANLGSAENFSMPGAFITGGAMAEVRDAEFFRLSVGGCWSTG